LVDVSTVTNTGSLNLSFDVNVTDADGDVSSGTLAVTVDGSNPIDGSAGNDSLAGDGSANTINGLAGNDILVGGGGDDILSGGTGSDTFKFSYGSGSDRITDFGVGNPSSNASADILQISDVLVGAHQANGAVPLDLQGAINQGFLFAQAGPGGVGTSLVLDLNGGADGGQTIVTLSNVAFTSSAQILSTLLGGDGVGGTNDQIK
jgi:Ca2+-binding RTX toxin-like protein